MTLCLNSVGFVWVNFATFIFNSCNVIKNPHSYIPRIHAIIVTSSSYVNTLASPIFPLFVFPFKWSKRELGGMFQDLLTVLNECVPFSTASMASSNVWFVHFPFFLIGWTLLTTWHGYLVFNVGYGGTFSLSKVTWSITTLHCLQGTLKIMMV
jgi:hypothetical protein